MPPPAPRAVDVVVWRPDGEAVATPLSLRGLDLRLDGESALPRFLDDVAIRAGGSSVSVLRMAESVVHVELLRPGTTEFDWRAPDDEIGGRGPWNRVGWFERTGRLISDTLREAEDATVSEIVQIKHGSIAALMRVDTDRGTFWFKQVPPAMVHEGRLIRRLAELRVGAVPEVVALGPDWMVTKAFGPSVDGGPVENAYGALAELQQAAAPFAQEFLDIGCHDLRLDSFPARLGVLSLRDDLLDAVVRERLAAALPFVSDLIDELDDGIPASVVHSDLHRGNWSRLDDGRWLIFDWTDGCVSHPFMDLGLIDPKDKDPKHAAWLDDYLQAWSGVVDPARLERTVRAARPVAFAFQALCYERVIDDVAAEDQYVWLPVLRLFADRLLEALSPEAASVNR